MAIAYNTDDPTALIKKPIPSVGALAPNPLIPGVPPQPDASQTYSAPMVGDAGAPAGGYNNPANAPVNHSYDGSGTPTDTPSGPNAYKAQGGTGPASAPPTDTAIYTPPQPDASQNTPAPMAASEEKMASNGARYTGPDYYQPDPNKANYQPNSALSWGPDSYYAGLANVGGGSTPASPPVGRSAPPPPEPSQATPAPMAPTIAPPTGFTPPPTFTPPGPPPALTLPSVGAGASDLRYGVVAPTDSARLQGVQGAADAAATRAANFDPAKAIGDNATDFAGRMATPDVGFGGIDTKVSRAAVDPNIAFNGVDTNVTRDAIDPTVAFNAVGTDVSAGPAVDPSVSADLAAYRAQQKAAADKLSSGPSRSEIAQKNLDAFDLRAQPQLRNQLRSVGQRVSALGRTGMGASAIEALTPYTDYLNNRAALSNELAASTASGEIADRQNNLSAAEGLVGSQFGQDTSTRGESRTERSNVQDVSAANLARRAAERNAGVSVAEGNKSRAQQEADAKAAIAAGNVSRRVGERNTALDVATGNKTRAQQEADAAAAIDTGNVNRTMDERNAGVSNAQTNAARQAQIRQAAISQAIGATGLVGDTARAGAGILAGREAQIGGTEASARGETRTERDAQRAASDKAIQDAVQQHLLESGDQQTGFDQALRTAELGNANNPATTYLNASGQSANSAASSSQALADLLRQYYASQQPARAA